MKTPQIPPIPGCTPLGIKPQIEVGSLVHWINEDSEGKHLSCAGFVNGIDTTGDYTWLSIESCPYRVRADRAALDAKVIE